MFGRPNDETSADRLSPRRTNASGKGNGWRRLNGLLLTLLVWLLPTAAQAVVLSDREAVVDPWDQVLILDTERGGGTIETILPRLEEFRPPTTPRGNLGTARDPVWLRLPLTVERSGKWLLTVDYPALDRVDAYLIAGGRTHGHEVLGDERPFAERGLRVRPPAMALELEPGMQYELLLHVRTKGAMLVPLRLVKVDEFLQREAAFQWLQGIVAGIGFSLTAYALANGISGRDRMFLWYAFTVASATMFFVSIYGIGAQHLWPGSPWLADRMGPMAILLMIGGGFLVVERMLDIATHRPALARAMVALGWTTFGVAGLFVSGVLPFRVAHAFAAIGVLPIVLALPVAYERWRGGDWASGLLFVGWAIDLVGASIQTALLRGWLDATTVAQHAFQVTALTEALIWLRVIGLRNAQGLERAAHAEREHDRLERLAHTDALTGLPNRRRLEAVLAESVSDATTDRSLALYVLDLDGFKAVNDELGHDGGDELLVAVARRLRGALRDGDTVARLGGDEFVVLAQALPGEAEAAALGWKLVGAIGEPFSVGGQRCSVGLTIGFVLAPQDGTQAAALMKRADDALYAGKQAGKGVLTRG